MPEHCAKCGSHIPSDQQKICQQCYDSLRRQNEYLLAIIRNLIYANKRLKEEITKLEIAVKRLLEYQDIVMDNSELWSKVIAKRLMGH